MLLTLPVELIQRVVRLSTPEEITSTFYQPRQDGLRSLCLVNSLLLDIAQPILDEALTIGPKTAWRPRFGHTGERKSRLRFLWVQRKATVDWTADLGTLCPLLEFVRDVRLCYMDEVHVETLAGALCLVRLTLHYVSLVESHAVLINVEELTCDVVNTARDDTTSFLSSSTFPKLKFLAYYREVQRNCSTSPSLLNQLVCVVFLDIGLANEPPLATVPRSCQPFMSVELAHIDETMTHLAHYAHYRVRFDPSVHSGSFHADGIRSLSRTITDFDPSTHRLSCVSLPSSFLTVAAPRCPGLGDAIDALVAAASARGIYVVFEEGEDKLGGSFLPLSTIEYARKLRAEQEKVDVV